MTARKWTIDRLIDVGGMAAVFEATHRNGNKVAIKVLHKQYAEMKDAVDRFLREGYVANKVGHKGALTILDDDNMDDGTPFLVMELLEGHPLEAFMRDGAKISVTQTLFVADQVLDVLAAAHANDIIHRDIKPGNVFITDDGGVKVLDYGLARVLDPGSNMSMTRTGTVIGTMGYMSPEQARGKREMIDHRTDIFAVGALMFRGLSAEGVHKADTPMDRLLAAMTDHAPPLASVVPEVPADVAAIVDRALAFQKTDRYPDCKAMQVDVRAAYQTHTGAAPPSTAQPRNMPPPPSRQPRVSGTDDIHVSVSIEEEAAGDSIFVEFSDVDTGDSKRVELRRKPSNPGVAAVTDDDPLSEVSVVLDED
jgi:serine/threonine protein kinase